MINQSKQLIDNKKINLIIPILVILSAVLAPFFLSPFMLMVLSRVLIMTILTYSLSFLAAGGMISFGQTIFFGLSGYTLAILLMRHGYPHGFAIVLALIAGLIGAAILGLIVVRTQGVYFIMITLALGQMAWAIALQWSALTGGDDGIIGIRPPEVLGISLRNRLYFYYVILLFFLLVFYLLKKINNSKFGLTLKAVGENPEKISALGYNANLIRYASFVISGFLAGVAGIFFVYFNGIINPVTVGIQRAVWILVAAILGGINFLIGPLIGVGAVMLMEVQLSRYTDRYMIVIGTVFVLVIMYMPEGLWGYAKMNIDKFLKLFA